MSCDGNCFDVDSWVLEQETSSPSTVAVERNPQLYGIDAEEIYTPLQQWQTRVLCLHPTTSSGLGTYDLHADLLVVNLHIVDGVTVDRSERIIEYTAISYVWGPPDTSYSLLCNGVVKSISRTVATALETLRHPTNPTYLWIDAICINQADPYERADQVAKMLDIYKKAQSVVAWLGEPGPNASLAFASIRNRSRIVGKLAINDRANSHRIVSHYSICFDRLRAIHSALMNLYDLHHRPWLRRTWIRQEVYAARQLVLQYGHHKIALDDFVSGARLLAAVRWALSENGDLFLPESNTMLTRLLEEAQSNATVPYSGVKPPRGLIEVLRSSSEFELKDERDTVYAVLGMCSVPTVTRNILTKEVQDSRRRGALLVDYSKSLVDIYHDTSLYMLNKTDDSEYWTRLYDVYKRSPMHHQGLASWAIDWRTGVLDQHHVSIVHQNLEPYRLSRGYSDISPFSDSRAHAINLSPVWRSPSPHQSSRAILVVQARVLNYIAYLSDLTCDPEEFFSAHGPGSRRYRDRNDLFSSLHEVFQIGTAGVSVHARRKGPVRGTYLFTRRPDHLATFGPKVHAWRIALLGIAHDAQLCLVPASAKKGDLVVALAPNMLPVLLRPAAGRHDGGDTGGLFNSNDDPYERVPYRPRRRTLFEVNDVPSFLPVLIGISMVAVSTGLSLAAMLINVGSLSRIIMVVYGAFLLCVFVCIWLYFKYQLNGWIATHCSRAKSLAGSGASKALKLTVTILSMTFISAATTGLDAAWTGAPNLLGIYCGALVAVPLVSFLWHFFVQMEHRIVIEIRRQKVLEHLDDAKNTIGEDYEFYGAMFVRRSRPSPWMSSHIHPRWLRWCLLRSYFFAHRYISDRLPLDVALFDLLLDQVYAGGGRKADEFLWLERPIQELKIY